jgi:hypothetical protein
MKTSEPKDDLWMFRSPEDETLVDRLKRALAWAKLLDSKIKTDLMDGPEGQRIVFDSRKYYNQAHNYLGITIRSKERRPPFLVSLSDLDFNPQLVQDFSKLHKQSQIFVMKRAVGRIFEDINYRLYHDHISKILTIGLVD